MSNETKCSYQPSIIPSNTPIIEGMLPDDATITASLQEIIKKTSNKKLVAFVIPMDGIRGLSGKDNLKFGLMIVMIGFWVFLVRKMCKINLWLKGECNEYFQYCNTVI